MFLRLGGEESEWLVRLVAGIHPKGRGKRRRCAKSTCSILRRHLHNSVASDIVYLEILDEVLA